MVSSSKYELWFGSIKIGLTECSIMKVSYLKVYSTHDSSKEFKFEFEQGQLGTFTLFDIFSQSQSAHWPQNQNVSTIHFIFAWSGQLSGTRIRSYLWAFLHNSEWITKKNRNSQSVGSFGTDQWHRIFIDWPFLFHFIDERRFWIIRWYLPKNRIQFD